MKKSTASLALCLALAALTAIPAWAQDAGWKSDTKPVTFDWYLNFSWFPNKWGVDATSQYVTKKTGVNVNFVVPAGNENEKLNTMIASDTLPDFITLGWWEEGVRKLIEGDLVYSLTDLAAKYDPYFNKVAVSSRLGWYKQPDGKVYGYPNASYAPEDYSKYPIYSNQTFLVRKDMYEALGKPDMRTPEGFLAALRAAKAKFPTVNGQPLIPFGTHEFGDTGCASLQDYLANFVGLPREKNGKFVDPVIGPDEPEYTRWLKTLSKASREGLITKDIFIDKRAQMEEKISQGRYFCMLFQRSDLQAQQNILYKNDPKTVYIAVDGFLNSKKEAPKLPGPGLAGWTVTLISKKCKDPARAIKFMSYLLSEEGQKDLYLGVPGVTYANDKWLPEVDALRTSDRSAFDKKYGADETFWMLMDNPMIAKWAPPSVEPFLQMEQWTKGKAVSYTVYDNIGAPSDSPEGIAYKNIQEEWGRTLPKLVMAKTDAEFDSLWKGYQDFKAKAGYAKIQDYQTKKVAENKAKLGLK